MEAINKLENDFNDIENIISDCDHVVRRLYRCFINGDYGHQHAFNYSPEFDIDGFKTNRSLRSFVIRSFCTNQALDYGLNYGQVQRWLVENIGHENLERLNEELMIDVSDLIHEYNA
tara:strand:- start:473 stop:823 length:351 start_codon:yes stop_codon:yes gene_type:complete